MDEIELYIATGEVEKPSQLDGHRRFSYVALRKTGDAEHYFWGVGRLKDMTALYAMAIDDALSELLEDLEENQQRHVAVLARGPNFWERIDQASTRETHRPKREAADRDAWKNAAVIRAFLEIEPARSPVGSSQEVLMRRAEARRSELQGLALSVPADCSGLWRQGNSSAGTIDEANL